MRFSFPVALANPAAVLIGGCLLGAFVGAPAGLSRLKPDDAPVRVVMAGKSYVFDGVTARAQGGDEHRIDVELRWDAASGTQPPSPVLMTLLPAAATSEPELWPSLIHARFVEAEVTEAEGGLLMRRFRDDSPYPGEVLYVPAVESGAGFSARCHEAARDDAPNCLAAIRRNGIDVVIRFTKPMLARWPQLMAHVHAVLTEARVRADG